MANINYETAVHTQARTGAWGNNSVEILTYDMVAAGIGDVVYLGKIPQYAKVHSVKLINEALGTDVTVSVGYASAQIVGGEMEADDNYWLNAVVCTSAATTSAIAAAVPKTFPEEAFITATIGVAAATGQIWVVIEYIYENQ